MRPLLRLLVPAALLAATVTVGPVTVAPSGAAVPVDACEPLDVDDEAAVVERAEKVDDVFVGRVSSVVRRGATGGGRAEPPLGTPAPSAPTTGAEAMRIIAHQVTVTTVLAGDLRLGQKVAVVFEPSPEGRTRLLGERETHLFFTTEVAGELRADYCEGSQVLPGGLSAPMQRTLEDYLSGAPEPPARVELHAPDGADEPPRLSRVLAPGAAISLVGVLGLLLLARVGRRRG